MVAPENGLDFNEIRGRESGRIFSLGCGPSLNGQVEYLPRLAQQTTFCCNRMALWEKLSFTPTYYICSANAVLSGEEPANPPHRRERFLSSRDLKQLRLEGWYQAYKKPFHDIVPTETFGEDYGVLKVRGGATHPGIMAQIALWMGYEQIYFLGIEQEGKGHCYDPAAQLKLVHFTLNQDRLFDTWRMLRDEFEAAGVKLRDCTPHGRLNDILGYEALGSVLA